MNYSLPLRLSVVVAAVDDSRDCVVAALVDIHVDRCCKLRPPMTVYSVATWSVADRNSFHYNFRNDFRSRAAYIVDIDASKAAH